MAHVLHPRLLIIGNANTGKSTITKLLLSNPSEYKGKIGKTPGSSLLIKPIHQEDMQYEIVDLPGFGFAKKSSHRREEHIKKQTISHIEKHHRRYFLGLVVINILRIEDELEKYFYKKKQTIPLSFELITFLLEFAIPLIILINKVDKVSVFDKRRIITYFVNTARQYGLNLVHLDDFGYDYAQALPYLEFSALKKTNLGDLKQALYYVLRNYQEAQDK
jgi:GTP-binding protein EngB required for normal cell division